ncbi:MAG TPA: FliG C-terminal domain-containing protein [Planctomycetota bacterium]
MKCLGCVSTAEGFAVIPGIGRAGEIRFFCDACARRERVKMRYWDGRDLDVGGWREKPDLGSSFSTLILSFADVSRMRREDLEPVVEWLEDPEIALALIGADGDIVERIYSVLPLSRVRAVRELMERSDQEGTAAAPTPQAARELFVSVIRRL